MAQYQSFPGAPGDSLTLDKLKKLSLPELAGRSFLDVGCNEGFFCGFATFQGAARSVGIDHSAGFIDRARRRFPECEFHAQGWDQLPQGPFDVILLASALHYAEDQVELLHRLMGLLSQDGVLVLEIGIVTSKVSEWVRVERGIDERLFPTMPKLREVLADYAWKWMGPSVGQSGDSTARHVLHIAHRRPAAYLLMHPPGFGKSSIAKSLFPKATIKVISGDQVIGRIAAGKVAASAELVKTVNTDYSPFGLDQVIQRVFDHGHGGELVDLWISQVGHEDFALDMYVPAVHQEMVKSALKQAGYLPVLLAWERPGAKFVPEITLHKRAEEFYLSLSTGPAETKLDGGGIVGFVDDVELAAGRLTLRGWSADATGRMPAMIAVKIHGQMKKLASFEKQLRPDVQKHLGMPHALVGYLATVDVDGAQSLDDIDAGLAVYACDKSGRICATLHLAGRCADKLKFA
jgi:SAM-dependent methyltransferase